MRGLRLPFLRRHLPRAVSSPPLAPLLLALALLGAGCGTLVSRRRVAALPTGRFQTASLSQLVDQFNAQANAIQSMRLKLDLSGSSGGPRSGTVSQLNWNITTFLLIEKPARVRLFGEVTIFGRVFDLASDGSEFEVNLPGAGKSGRFILGPVNAPASAPLAGASAIEKLRPGIILDAMLINPIQLGASQHVIAINDRAETNAEYGVLVYAPGADGYDRLLRRIVFSRYNLLPLRQVIYDAQGRPATQAGYANYVVAQGVSVPTEITITRPQEEFSLTLKVQPGGITLNPPPMPPSTWQIEPPQHAAVEDLGASH